MLELLLAGTFVVKGCAALPFFEKVIEEKGYGVTVTRPITIEGKLFQEKLYLAGPMATTETSDGAIRLGDYRYVYGITDGLTICTVSAGVEI